MALVQINRNPSRKDLNFFSKFSAFFLTLLSAVLYWLKDISLPWAAGILAIGWILFLIHCYSPKTTRLIYLAFSFAGYPFGLAISIFCFFTVYFLLITPLALFFKAIGRDPLHRKCVRSLKSYWIAKNTSRTPESYYHQF